MTMFYIHYLTRSGLDPVWASTPRRIEIFSSALKMQPHSDIVFL